MRAFFLSLIIGLTALAAQAQSPFSPAITVNNDVITFYELDQRARLLQVLRTPGNLAEVAREQLIEDRLKLQEARRAGLVLTPEATQAALEEFAQRANLTLPQFLEVLAASGVEPATLRDLVVSGVTWRDYVRQRFARQGQVSETELDAALATGGSGTSNIRVLISEIIIPAPPPRAAQVQAIAERISQVQSAEAFSAFAREYSALPSRANGGQLPWTPLSDLPAGVQPLILSLSPGEVTSPLGIPNAVALFQLRAIEETSATAPTFGAIEYATFFLQGGLSPETLAQAALLDARTDTCDDLYGEARGLPAEALQRDSLPPAQIEQDIAMELSKLDPGETSAVLTRNGGQTLLFLMLCGRTPVIEGGGTIDRDAVGNQIRNRRLNDLAEAALAQLRADAVIRSN